MNSLYDESTTLDLLAKIQSQLQDYEPTLVQSEVISGQARYLTWDFANVDIDQLEILQITDSQFGHKQCNVEVLQQYFDWVLRKPSRYVLLGGDMVDAGHVQSKGSPFEQVGDPQEELWRFAELAAPLRHRILGYVGGNHERRSIPTFGDLGKSLATILKIPYSPGMQHIDIKFGDHQPFKISQHHGKGASQTIGSIANDLERFIKDFDSQLYLLGHLHRAVTIPATRTLRDGKGGFRYEKVIGARGSSFLGYSGTYAEVIMRGTPQAILMPKAVLEKDGTWYVMLK